MEKYSRSWQEHEFGGRIKLWCMQGESSTPLGKVVAIMNNQLQALSMLDDRTETLDTRLKKIPQGGLEPQPSASSFLSCMHAKCKLNGTSSGLQLHDPATLLQSGIRTKHGCFEMHIVKVRTLLVVAHNLKNIFRACSSQGLLVQGWLRDTCLLKELTLKLYLYSTNH